MQHAVDLQKGSVIVNEAQEQMSDGVIACCCRPGVTVVDDQELVGALH